MVRHTDWWLCPVCEVRQPVITEEYDYTLTCPRCGIPMRLMVRTEDLGKPPFPGRGGR